MAHIALEQYLQQALKAALLHTEAESPDNVFASEWRKELAGVFEGLSASEAKIDRSDAAVVVNALAKAVRSGATHRNSVIRGTSAREDWTLNLNRQSARAGPPIRIVLTASEKGSETSVVALGQSGTGLGVVPRAAIASLLSARARIVAMMNGAPRMRPAELVRFGDAMGEILFGGEVRDTWSHAASVPPLVTEIVATTRELKAVPWEYVAFPGKRGPHPQFTVVRLVPQAIVKSLEAPDIQQGLRVLMLSASPLSFERIPWPDIRDTLVMAFKERLPQLEVVADSQPSSNTHYLRIVDAADPTSVARAVIDVNPHVVHFVGHGTDQGIALIDSKSAKKSVLLSAGGFRAALGRAPALRLVILSACDVANPSAIDPVDESVGTFAEQLVREGVPAVVASQMVIDRRTIATFCEGFYASLLEYGSVDQAVAAGRCQVLAQLETAESAAIEWGIPVLYRSLGSSQLFSRTLP